RTPHADRDDRGATTKRLQPVLCLWRRERAVLPYHDQRLYDRRPGAGDRDPAALCQLWRHIADDLFDNALHPCPARCRPPDGASVNFGRRAASPTFAACKSFPFPKARSPSTRPSFSYRLIAILTI